jgi:hypothetical protein
VELPSVSFSVSIGEIRGHLVMSMNLGTSVSTGPLVLPRS